ncbi:unnamed protein product [Blumeria hordei]|uniref:Uncharacterized protein n=1 Tax=Blumeria hordei TaxID=2867405 RepID=A0A383UNC5_BLUHO|nr:unnamed protein product [Blumeria hordei]
MEHKNLSISRQSFSLANILGIEKEVKEVAQGTESPHEIQSDCENFNRKWRVRFADNDEHRYECFIRDGGSLGRYFWG